MRAALPVLLLLSAVCAHAQYTPKTAAAEAAETVNAMGSGANPAYFQAGKDFANSPSGISAVKGAITGANAADKVPGYATTHEHASLFAGGDGNLVGPGASKVQGCAGFKSTDKAKQYECDAINLVAGNPPRPKFDVKSDDPIIAKGKAVKNELAAIKDAFGEKYSACQTKTVTQPDTYTTEVCADIIGNDPASCVYGRKVEIDAKSNFQCDKTVSTLSEATRNTSVNVSRCTYGRKVEIDAKSNFQCDKTVNAYETHKCRRSFQPEVAERCDASTPYSTGMTTVSASWWWCGDTCVHRADTFINTLVGFATSSVGLALEGIYRVSAACTVGVLTSYWGYQYCQYAPVWITNHTYDSSVPTCPYGGSLSWDEYSPSCLANPHYVTAKVGSPTVCGYPDLIGYYANFTGSGPDIQIYMDGVYQAQSKTIGYKCDVSICYGSGTCFYKGSKKPNIEFRASVSVAKDCTNKVWTCHHKGRFPCHWACKDSGVLCSGGTLTANPDGSYSCLSNCRNVLAGVTQINECATLEARSK